jgi:hypothetical protein
VLCENGEGLTAENHHGDEEEVDLANRSRHHDWVEGLGLLANHGDRFILVGQGLAMAV